MVQYHQPDKISTYLDMAFGLPQLTFPNEWCVWLFIGLWYDFVVIAMDSESLHNFDSL